MVEFFEFFEFFVHPRAHLDALDLADLGKPAATEREGAVF